MIKRFNHIGMVVKSLEEALDFYVNTLGFEKSEIMTLEEMGLKSVMVNFGEVTFELMEPTGAESSVRTFLQKRGEGLHHVSLEVDDMKKERNSLESKGIHFLESEPRCVDNSCVSFIHPKFTKGVLFELVQRL